MEPRDDRGKRTPERNTREVSDDLVCANHQSVRCKVDPDHLLGLVGIVGTVLNLLVVVLVYIYTPV